MQLLRALRHRRFALVFAGETVSSLGDRLHKIALIWWVLVHTGTGAALGTLAVFTTVPTIAFLLVGGVLVDRMPRAWIMMISDLVRAGLAALTAILVYTDRLELPIVYALAVAFGFVDAFFRPAYNALVPDVVPQDDLPSANSLTALGDQLTGVAGPMLGAILVDAGGTGLAFALNSASFIVSASCLFALPRLPTPERAADANALRELREGLATVIREPWLWGTVVFWAVLNAIDNGLFSVSLPFMIKSMLHLDIGSLSFVQSASAMGAIFGAVWLGRRQRLARRGMFAYGAGLVIAACWFGTGIDPVLIAIAGFALVRNVALTAFDLVWVESVQSTVPREKLGRVASVDAFASLSLMPFGYAATGWATDHVNPPTVFVIGGVVLAAAALPALLHPRIRRFD